MVRQRSRRPAGVPRFDGDTGNVVTDQLPRVRYRLSHYEAADGAKNILRPYRADCREYLAEQLNGC